MLPPRPSPRLTLLPGGLLAAALLISGSTAPARAQAPCTAETEPNDTPESAVTFHGAVCVVGELGDGDQDLVIWDVSELDAGVPWTVQLEGVPGTLTSVKLVLIASEPGVTPVTTGAQVLEVDSPPALTGTVTQHDILVPAGRYVVGVVRSSLADGSPPPETGYRMSIEPGTPLPPSGDTEPNDEDAMSSPVSNAFALSGDLQGSSDIYAWTLAEGEAVDSWEIHYRGPLASSTTMTLRGPAGTLATAASNAGGHAALYDLRLGPGTYSIELSPAVDHLDPYSLSAVHTVGAAADAEPNDAPATALPFDPSAGAARGRLAWDSDRDDYRLTVDASLAAVQFDLKLIWGPRPDPKIDRQLCLLDASGAELQCRGGAEGATLSNLLLTAGEYTVEIRGGSSLDDRYLLRLDRTTPPTTDFETEPNDRAILASRFDASGGVRGRLAPDEYDYVHATTTGEAQLWELRAGGSALTRLDWTRPDEAIFGQGEISPDGTSAFVTDMYLIPGEHWFRVSGTGDYSLRLVPLGPPDPNAEREPNGDSLSAEPFAIGQARTGRLPTANDADIYRFSLAATEHVLIRIDPPEDGAVSFVLQAGRVEIGGDRNPPPGHPGVYDALLEAGDYELWLRPVTVSSGHYSLTIERRDPLTAVDDQEPNGTATLARPMPRGHVLQGTGTSDGDIDWYRLQPPTDGAIALRVDGSVYGFALSDGTNDYELTRDGDTGVVRADSLPADLPLYLRVTATGDYSAQLVGPGAPPATSVELPVDLSFRASSAEVAAYWPTGQRLGGSIALTNTGTSPLELTLDAVTSHYAWSIELESDLVSLAPGETHEIVAAIRVLPDAWADVPVRVTARVSDASGAQRTAFVEITPGRDAPPVAPEQAWSVPDALLGGLDVASIDLGAVPAGTVDAALEAQLHDGVTPSGGGFYASYPAMPLALTVDLAGDEPVPVAGTILNPQGMDAEVTDLPLGFELLLSLDGTTYELALAGELSPLNIDQDFVLDRPVLARFAQLRINSTRDPAASRVVLGEWKVVAAPGSAPSPVSPNMADPASGGHVVAMIPNSEDLTFTDGMLSEDPTLQILPVKEGTVSEWVVGFQDDRAAQVTELHWVDPPGSDSRARFKRVALALSTDSPVGPWSDIGTWTLARADDGSVVPFALDAPAWARFIRFTTEPSPKAVYAVEMPATIRILERPTDTSYRSALGEWGQTGQAGPYEWLVPPDATVPDDETAPNDTPEAATHLGPGDRVAGRAQGIVDVDWYRVTIPDGQNSVSFTVGGRPTVGVSIALFDDAAARVPMSFGPGSTPGTVVYSANVTAGATYTVRVEQPPFSAVFTFDTSGSIGPYLAFVAQALRAYTADVTKGQEQISIIPFEEQPLLPGWSDEPYLLQNAVDRYVPGNGSSSAEQALLDASHQLEAREGARAILIVTDAETSSYQQEDELWAQMASTRPLIFAVHIGGNGEPVQSRHFMQDWAATAGGFYQYARSHGEVDRAFDRMATWLRRPAAYRLLYETSEELVPPPDPGALSVTTAGIGTPAPVGSGVAIEIVLDTSGSMLDRFGGQRRIDIAKRVLASAVRNDLPAGVPIALRVFRQQKNSCASELALPLGPLDNEGLASLIEGLKVDRSVNTPLAAALKEVASDLAGVAGRKIVILVSDGEESCGGNPARVVRQLKAQGLEITLNVVGLALDDRKIRKSIQELAALGNGSYFDARNPTELDRALAGAVSAPFEVYDEAGGLVGGGTVNGPPLRLPPGIYRVVVLTDPPVTYDSVVVETNGSVTLTLPTAPTPTPAPTPTAAP